MPKKKSVPLDEEAKKKEELRLLKIRRKYELKLVKKFDRTKIDLRKECWYLMDAKWLNAWSSFVAGEVDDPPGPVSSAELFVPILESTNNEASHDSEKGEESKGEEKETKKYKPFVRVTPAVPYSKLLPGLRPKIDYRAVPPVVFYLFVELHGKDNSPELCRYVIDIYKYAIPVEDLINIQYTAMTTAKIEVNKVRTKWVKWEIDQDEDDDEEDCWCCGLTKEHLEAFIFWAVTCWNRSKNRKSSGRADIKYRNYKPLKNNDKIIKEEEGIVTEDVGGSSWNIFGRVARWFQYKGPGDMGDVPQPGDSNYKYDDTPPFVPSQKNEEAEIEMRRRATLEKSKKKKAKKKVVKVAAPVEESNTNGNENNKNGKMTFNAAFNMPEDDSEDDDEEDALYAEKERLYDIADRDYGKGMWLFRR